MSTATQSLWDQATPEVKDQDIHPLWKQATPDKNVIITSKTDEDPGFVSSFRDQANPKSIGAAVAATTAPYLATAAGFGLANRNAIENPEQHQAIIDKFKTAHDAAAEAIKKGDYLGAAKVGQDLFLGEGIKEPVDKMEDQVSKGDYAGAAGTTLGALSQFAIGHGIGRLADFAGPWISKLRTPDPDLSLLQAVKPHQADTDFYQNIPDVRANVKRGESLSDTPITDVQSALKATQASMDEHMQAIDAHKDNTRIRGDVLPTSTIKSNAIQALPKGLADANPKEYNDAVNEINSLFPGKDYLNVDEVFDQAHLNNGKLARFHSSPESAQNSKMVTNGGDTASLKAEGDTYRQWINDHVGPLASDINSDWGDLNGFKHYLQAKINPSLMEKPLTKLGEIEDNFGLIPNSTLTNPKSIAGSILKKVAGQPTKIDDLIKSAFENSDAAKAPVEPNKYVYNNPGNPAKQLTSGSVITPPPTDESAVRVVPGQVPYEGQLKALPPASSQIGVSGVTVPADIAGKNTEGSVHLLESGPNPPIGGPREHGPIPDQSQVRSVPAMTQPPTSERALPAASTRFHNPTPDESNVRGADAMNQPPPTGRALPQATTRFQGDVSPGSGLPSEPSHTLPTLPDGSKLQILNPSRGVARDPKTGQFYRYYTNGQALTKIDKLTIRDLGA